MHAYEAISPTEHKSDMLSLDVAHYQDPLFHQRLYSPTESKQQATRVPLIKNLPNINDF